MGKFRKRGKDVRRVKHNYIAQNNLTYKRYNLSKSRK